MKKILSLLIIVIVLAGCEQKKAPHQHETATVADTSLASARLYNEVMAVHNEVMPRMDEIMNDKAEAKKALARLDSIARANPKAPHLAQKKQLDSLLLDLDRADEAMMDWMNQFDSKMAGKTEAEKIAYLQEQKVKVAEMKKTMLGSLEKAGKILH